jgi:hypothetical protein
MEEFIFKDGGIYINPKNKGKFTKKAKAAGMGVQEFARHVLANKDDYPTSTVKQANFARNAKKWKKKKAFPGATIAMALPGVIQGIQNIREQKQQERSAKEFANVSSLFSHLKDPRFTPEKDVALPFVGTNYDQGTTYVADTGISILGKMWPGLDKANKTLGEYGLTPERILGFANQTGDGYTQTLGSIGTGIGGPIGGAALTVAGLLSDWGQEKRIKRYQEEYDRNASLYLTPSSPLYAKKGAVVAEKGGVSVGDLTKISESVYGINGNLHSEGGTPLSINGVPVEAERGEVLVHLENGGEILNNSSLGDSLAVVFGNMKIKDRELLEKFKDIKPKKGLTFKKAAEYLGEEKQKLEERREQKKDKIYYPGSPADVASRNTDDILGEKYKEIEDAFLDLSKAQSKQLEKKKPENIITAENGAAVGPNPPKITLQSLLSGELDNYWGLSTQTLQEKQKESTIAGDTKEEDTPFVPGTLSFAISNALDGSSEERNLENQVDTKTKKPKKLWGKLFGKESKEQSTTEQTKDLSTPGETGDTDKTKQFVQDSLNVFGSLLPLMRNPRYRTPRIPYELIGQIRPEMVPMPEDPRLMPITPVSGNELELVRAIAAATQAQDRRGTTPFAEQKIQEVIDYRNNLYDQAIKAQAENVGRYNAMAAQTQAIAASVNRENIKTKMDAQTARINMMLDFIRAEQMAQRDRNTLRMAAQAFPNYYFGPDGGLRFIPNFAAIADMFNTRSDSKETQAR